MERVDGNWAVYLGSAWAEQEAARPGGVVTVVDEKRGLRYEVEIGPDNGKPGIRRIAITPLDGSLVDQSVLDRIPLRKIAKTAEDFLSGRLRVAEGQPVTPLTPRKNDRPSSVEVATHWKVDGWGRQELARRYGVSDKTADTWISAARRQGLIPPATTGRPARKQQQSHEEGNE
jgi:hypothetical protein